MRSDYDRNEQNRLIHHIVISRVCL